VWPQCLLVQPDCLLIASQLPPMRPADGPDKWRRQFGGKPNANEGAIYEDLLEVRIGCAGSM